MRTLLAPALLLSLLIAGCTTSNPAEHKFRLRNYMTELMRKGQWASIRTDDDSRARKPTKYTDATKGLVFALRHTALFDDNSATICTWVYEDRAARDAAKPGLSLITDDLTKATMSFRTFSWDTETPELHATVIMESKSSSLANQYQILFRELQKNAAELPSTPAEK